MNEQHGMKDSSEQATGEVCQMEESTVIWKSWGENVCFKTGLESMFSNQRAEIAAATSTIDNV